MPLFFGLDYDAIIEPLEKFRTPETVKKYPPMKAGEHLMRMTISSFRYMNDAVEAGVFTPDYVVPEENPFKREAKEPAA